MLNSTATLNPNPLSKLSFNFSSQPEQKLSPQSFEEWRKYIYDLSGIYFQDNIPPSRFDLRTCTAEMKRS